MILLLVSAVYLCVAVCAQHVAVQSSYRQITIAPASLTALSPLQHNTQPSHSGYSPVQNLNCFSRETFGIIRVRVV